MTNLHECKQIFYCTSDEREVEFEKEIKTEEALLKSLGIALNWLDKGKTNDRSF